MVKPHIGSLRYPRWPSTFDPPKMSDNIRFAVCSLCLTQRSNLTDVCIINACFNLHSDVTVYKF